MVYNRTAIPVIDVSSCSANIPPKPMFYKDSKNLRAIYNNVVKWKEDSVGDITISFNPLQGSQSALGIGSNNINPSMNFKWVDPPLKGFEMDGFTFNFDTKGEFRNGCSSNSNSECTIGNETTFNNGKPALCVADGIYCNPEFVPGSVILHEFGHALGLYHEHQNFLDGTPIEYDVDGATLYSLSQYGNDTCIDQYCKKLCYSDNIRPSFCNEDCDPNMKPSFSCEQEWRQAKELAQTNILNVYNCPSGRDDCIYDGSDFDPYSVMIYEVADYVIKPDKNGVRYNPTRKNFVYSNTDKDILGVMYPKITKNGGNIPKINVKFVDKVNEETWKHYWVKKVVMEQLAPIVGIDFIFDLEVRIPSSSEEPGNSDDVFTPSPVSGTPVDDGNTETNLLQRIVDFLNNNLILSLLLIIVIVGSIFSIAN